MAGVMSALRNFSTGFLMSLPVVVAVSDNIVGISRVHGDSMLPSLQHGDVVLVAKYPVVAQHKYETGSVYVLKSPSEPDKLLVKRVLALSGSPFRVYIPTGHAWIRGDNRGATQDSQTHWGAVPLGLFKGKVVCVLWPPTRAQMVQRQSVPAAWEFAD